MNDPISTLLRASAHQFIGRLGRDPEVRFFDNGNSVCNASIAINRPGSKKDDGQEADWIKLEIWGEDGQGFADQCRKGQEVHVVGRIKTDRWTDRNSGEQKMALCCIVRQWQAIQPPAPAKPAAPAEPAVAPDEDEIPF
jgi:single-strand DNA-binding protein